MSGSIIGALGRLDGVKGWFFERFLGNKREK